MKTMPQEESSPFIESVENHQNLVNILLDAKNKDGISQLSQPEMAKLMNRSQTWVVKAIKRLNTEDTCIEMIAPGKYVVHYTNIYMRGVFSEILKLTITISQDVEMFFLRDEIISKKYGIKVKTVQMFKSYMRIGWRKNLSEG